MIRKLHKRKTHTGLTREQLVNEIYRLNDEIEKAAKSPAVIVPPLRAVEWNLEAAARVGYEGFLRLATKDRDLNKDARVVGWEKLDPDIRANWKILAREVITAALKPT